MLQTIACAVASETVRDAVVGLEIQLLNLLVLRRMSPQAAMASRCEEVQAKGNTCQ